MIVPCVFFSQHKLPIKTIIETSSDWFKPKILEFDSLQYRKYPNIIYETEPKRHPSEKNHTQYSSYVSKKWQQGIGMICISQSIFYSRHSNSAKGPLLLGHKVISCYPPPAFPMQQQQLDF